MRELSGAPTQRILNLLQWSLKKSARRPDESGGDKQSIMDVVDVQKVEVLLKYQLWSTDFADSQRIFRKPGEFLEMWNVQELRGSGITSILRVESWRWPWNCSVDLNGFYQSLSKLKGPWSKFAEGKEHLTKFLYLFFKFSMQLDSKRIISTILWILIVSFYRKIGKQESAVG